MMKKLPITLLVLVPLVAMPLGAQQPVDSKELLQSGLFAEEAEQALDKAAEHYEQILQRYAAERDYAVVALYRLAEVRRKQDRGSEAASLYQRILSEFPNAEPQVRLSRENLKAMGVAAASPVEMAIPDDPDEDKELRRLMILAENSPGRVWENVSQPQRSDISPLSRAASKGWLRVATWLLDHLEGSGENPLERDVPLYCAAENGHLELCRLLHARGAKIERADGALVAAIQRGFDPVADWLVENGANINEIGQGFVEVRDGSKQGVTDPDTGIWRKVRGRVSALLSPLAAAIASDSQDWIDRLLDLGADVNRLDRRETAEAISALSIASMKGYAPLVRRLLAAGADVQIEESLSRRSVGSIRPLPTAATGWTPLHYGAVYPEVIELLLEAGANPNAADSLGVRPIHVAAMSVDPNCVRLLAEAGVDLNAEADLKLQPAVISGGARYEFVRRTPLLIALDRKDLTVAHQVIAALVELGAQLPLDRPEDLGEVPQTTIFLSEEFLFPQLAARPAISIAFPEAARSFELAASGGDGEAPPSLASALLSWNNTEEIRRPRDYGFNWKRPVLWRREADGSFSKVPVDIMAEAGYPELRWGDIIAFSSGHLDRQSSPVQRSPGSSRRSPVFETSIPQEVIFALRGAAPFEIEIDGVGGLDGTFTVNGGMAVRTPPWATLPRDPFLIFKPILGARGSVVKAVSVRRGSRLHTLRSDDGPGPEFSLEAGDVIVGVEPAPMSARRNSVTLIDPEHSMLILNKNIGKVPESGDTAPYAGGYGTLFQFLAAAYARAVVHVDPAQAGELERRYALRRAHRGDCLLITHPDFSSLRIRRMGGGEDEIIEVPLDDFIAACNPATPPAECRSKDIVLEPGDIVELRSQAGRQGEPWAGFDEATARFFEKALTYQVVVRPAGADEMVGRVRWKVPQFVETKAGPVGYVDPKLFPLLLNRGEALRVLLPGSAGRCVNSGGALVDGMVIEQDDPRRKATAPPTRSGRRIVYPPKSR